MVPSVLATWAAELVAKILMAGDCFMHLCHFVQQPPLRHVRDSHERTRRTFVVKKIKKRMVCETNSMAALRVLPATFRGHPADLLAIMGDFGDLLLILHSNLSTGYKTHQ